MSQSEIRQRWVKGGRGHQRAASHLVTVYILTKIVL